jgi:hypothetical protein
MEVQKINPLELSFNPIYSSNKSVDWDYSNFLNNISVYGQQKPIIVDEDLCVLDGNKRLQALIDLNIQAVEIITIEELNFNVDICNLKPSEKIIILELFEEKYSLSQYSSKNASIAVKAIRTILFGGAKHLREYYELKKILIELHKLNTLLFNQIINQLDSFEISIPEAIHEVKKIINKNSSFDFRVFSLKQLDILQAA